MQDSFAVLSDLERGKKDAVDGRQATKGMETQIQRTIEPENLCLPPTARFPSMCDAITLAVGSVSIMGH